MAPVAKLGLPPAAATAAAAAKGCDAAAAERAGWVLAMMGLPDTTEDMGLGL